MFRQDDRSSRSAEVDRAVIPRLGATSVRQLRAENFPPAIRERSQLKTFSFPYASPPPRGQLRRFRPARFVSIAPAASNLFIPSKKVLRLIPAKRWSVSVVAGNREGKVSGDSEYDSNANITRGADPRACAAHRRRSRKLFGRAFDLRFVTFVFFVGGSELK
jgi:hypothetical protein